MAVFEDDIAWHTERANLYAELHARPFKIIASDALISHVALLCNEAQREQQKQQLLTFLQQRQVDVERIEGSCQVYHTQDLIIRYEQHLEFTSLTITEQRNNLSQQVPFIQTALSRLPADWFQHFPGTMIAAFHLHICFEPVADVPKPQILKPRFDDKLMIGSWPQQGAAQVWTNFHTHKDNFGRFLIYNRSMTKGQMGRMVQRLIEIETYRLMALLGYVEARALAPDLKEMDATMAKLTEQLASGLGDDDHVLLKQLTDLASQIEAHRARTTFRFNASTAYHESLQARIIELDEDEVSGHLTIKEFLSRRLTPAVRSCATVQERLENLPKRVNRASDMLRTRVELALHHQNQLLLSSLERRSRIQLAMQHTVEGLSVAAISYYSVGLFKYLTDALYAAGAQFNKTAVLGMSVPVIVGAVWYVTHKIHNRFKHMAKKQ